MNLLIKKIKRVGHGFRNLGNYRIRLPLHYGVDWHTARREDQRPHPTLNRVEPLIPLPYAWNWQVYVTTGGLSRARRTAIWAERQASPSIEPL